MPPIYCTTRFLKSYIVMQMSLNAHTVFQGKTTIYCKKIAFFLGWLVGWCEMKIFIVHFIFGCEGFLYQCYMINRNAKLLKCSCWRVHCNYGFWMVVISWIWCWNIGWFNQSINHKVQHLVGWVDGLESMLHFFRDGLQYGCRMVDG